MLYTVRRLREQSTAYSYPERIDADDHRDAATRSGLRAPGAELLVNDGHTVIRYHVDSIGRLVEQSRYSA
jgi:hypothetical protein